jgi:hypothetical protein
VPSVYITPPETSILRGAAVVELVISVVGLIVDEAGVSDIINVVDVGVVDVGKFLTVILIG